VRWIDLDLDGNPIVSETDMRLVPVVAVRQNVYPVKGKGLVVHGGKTSMALRIVPLPPADHVLVVDLPHAIAWKEWSHEGRLAVCNIKEFNISPGTGSHAGGLRTRLDTGAPSPRGRSISWSRLQPRC
jgi:hypothetical protein